MYEEDEAFKELLTGIKEINDLVPEPGKSVNFDTFIILNKVDHVRKSYVWRIIGNSLDLYLVSFYNSYRLNVSNPGLKKGYQSNVTKYLCVYVEFNFEWPHSIIKPNTWADKLAEAFLHANVKLPNRTRFNANYILQSADELAIAKKLSSKLIDLIEEAYDIHMEFNKDKCIVYNLSGVVKENDYQKMIDIGAELSKLNTP